MSAQNTAGKFDVSRTGTLLYQKGSAGTGALSTVQWIDSTGKMEPLLANPGGYETARISPDGKRLAIAVRDGPNQNIQVYEWQSGRTTSLTFGGATYADPIWTPDGESVVFRATNGNMYSARADGSGQPQRLTQGRANAPQVPWSFSPDGKRLAFMQPVSGNFQLWTIPMDQRGAELRAGMPEQFLKSESTDVTPAFSPDGKWLAYRSGLSGGPQIYVRPSSGQVAQWVVSTQLSTSPVWSRAGRDLLYVTLENQVVAVSYTARGDTFVADKPRVWLARFAQTDFDLSPDGKRIVAIVPVQSAAGPLIEHEVVFLQNFFDELRRRVPGSR
jgi:Tol biopolymer transport system component